MRTLTRSGIHFKLLVVYKIVILGNFVPWGIFEFSSIRTFGIKVKNKARKRAKFAKDFELSQASMYNILC